MPRLIEGLGHVKQLVEELKARPYSELAQLPLKWDIATPTELAGLTFYGRRKTGEMGGIEIMVVVKKRMLFVLGFILWDGFEVFADGKIENLHPSPEEASDA